MVQDVERVVGDRCRVTRCNLPVIVLWSFAGAAAILARILDPQRREDYDLEIGRELDSADAEPWSSEDLL
jgi:hypothetical protein